MYQTNDYEGMQAETVTMQGHKGDTINAYYARPLGEGPHPGMVIIHHAPGWDEWYRECARRFAHHGYATISPNLYFRDGNGTPEDVGAKVRAAGGVPDDQVLGRPRWGFKVSPFPAPCRQEGRRFRHMLGRAARVSCSLQIKRIRRFGGVLGRRRRYEARGADTQAARRSD